MTATKTKGKEAKKAATPIRPHGVTVVDSGDPKNWNMQVLVGTPTRGHVTIDWVAALRALVIPANWGYQWLPAVVDDSYPVQFTVAHAQNVIVQQLMTSPVRYEWLLLYEDDMLPPPDLFLKLDRYMKDGPPIVSALYFQKGYPQDPLVYRGRGNRGYTDWKIGQRVWCDGVATGMLLIHRSILEVVWNESSEYTVHGQTVREVFVDPRRVLIDLNGQYVGSESGTSDLAFCARVIQDDVLKRAGWPKVARKKWPFLVDTSILCRHIAPDRTVYPP
jgi:hypothetical protein